MTVDVRMNYPSMENMAKAFKGAAQTLESTAGALGEVQKLIEEGALHGEAGEELYTGIQSKLIPRLNILRDKMLELHRDINGAVAAKRDGVKDAQSRFK